jgi:hypothetical protein
LNYKPITLGVQNWSEITSGGTQTKLLPATESVSKAWCFKDSDAHAWLSSVCARNSRPALSGNQTCVALCMTWQGAPRKGHHLTIRLSGRVHIAATDDDYGVWWPWLPKWMRRAKREHHTIVEIVCRHGSVFLLITIISSLRDVMPWALTPFPLLPSLFAVLFPLSSVFRSLYSSHSLYFLVRNFDSVCRIIGSVFPYIYLYFLPFCFLSVFAAKKTNT